MVEADLAAATVEAGLGGSSKGKVQILTPIGSSEGLRRRPRLQVGE